MPVPTTLAFQAAEIVAASESPSEPVSPLSTGGGVPVSPPSAGGGVSVGAPSSPPSELQAAATMAARTRSEKSIGSERRMVILQIGSRWFLTNHGAPQLGSPV